MQTPRRAWIAALAAGLVGWFSSRAEGQGGGFAQGAGGFRSTASGGVGGSGTDDCVAVFTGGSSVGNARITDPGTGAVTVSAALATTGSITVSAAGDVTPNLSSRLGTLGFVLNNGVIKVGNSTTASMMWSGTTIVRLASGVSVGWSSGANDPEDAASDTGVGRQAAGVVLASTGGASHGCLALHRLLTGYDCAITAGDVTQNHSSGHAAIENGASSVTITNSLVTNCSVVLAVLGALDTTATTIRAVVVDAAGSGGAAGGSFTIHANAVATADTCVRWWIVN